MSRAVHFLFVAAVVLAANLSTSGRIATAGVIAFGSGSNTFQIEFVNIGSPGNAPDTTGFPNPAGSVAYEYGISKFEISRDMIDKANAVGGLGISMQDMTAFGGNGASKPATGVTWNETARFVNWLNTSSGYQAAYKFNGSNFTLWQVGDTGFDAANPFRNSLARFVLPSIDEYYKAAYFDPAKPGGAGYWDYATGSDSVPTFVGSGTTPGTVVFNQLAANGPAAVDQAGGLSPIGIMGLTGNVGEYLESAYDGTNNTAGEIRHTGRAAWNSFDSAFLASTSIVQFQNPIGEHPNLGFRIVSLNTAAVPEPGTFALTAFGAIGIAIRRRFGRRHVSQKSES